MGTPNVSADTNRQLRQVVRGVHVKLGPSNSLEAFVNTQARTLFPTFAFRVHEEADLGFMDGLEVERDRAASEAFSASPRGSHRRASRTNARN
jgi:hypothetical protein